MKVFLLLICIYKVISLSCPNLCSGHGTCETGSCVCYPGWMQGDCSLRTCPYGQSFSVAGAELAKDNDDITFYLECSGQGSCNRQTGLCECYPGYNGNACQRMKCPNDCSGHGFCYPLEYLGVQYDSLNIKASLNETSYTNSDITVSQATACVCDKEYTGIDCSERKCPTGFVRTSDCEAPSDPPQIIKFDYSNKGATKEPCLAYLEYTDFFGRVWYSDAFCVIKLKQDEYAKDDKGNSIIAGKSDDMLGWREALLRFPIGTIALVDDVTKLECKEKGGNSGNYDCEMTIRLDQISGRQKQIKIITAKNLDDGNSKYSTENDYHGMSSTELEKLDDNFAPFVATSISYDSLSGVSPTSCSSSGICNKATGTCECFSGFTGISCSEISEAV